MGKKAKGKKHLRQLWKAYEVKGDAVERKLKFSPKDSGSFMANHKSRQTCGKTGYTEFK